MLKRAIFVAMLILAFASISAQAFGILDVVDGFYEHSTNFAGTMAMVDGSFRATEYALMGVGNLPANISGMVNLGKQAVGNLVTWNTGASQANTVTAQYRFPNGTNRVRVGEPVIVELFYGDPTAPLTATSIPAGFSVIGGGPGYLALSGSFASPGQYQISFLAQDSWGRAVTVVCPVAIQVGM